MRIVLLTALMVVYGVVYSQSPPKPNPAQSQKSASTPERGTEKSPLFIRGEVTSNKTEAEANDDARERIEKREVEQSLVKYTGLTALFAGFAVLVAFFQLLMFWRQLGLMRESLDDAKTVAKASERTANTAHSEFIAAHRPKVVVRRLSWINDDAGSHVGIKYAIKNIGDGPGTVVAISAMVWLSQSGEALPPVPPYPAAQEANIALKSGDWIDSRHTVDDGLMNNIALIVGYNNVRSGDPTPNILFLGYIDYIDGDGRKLQTGFLRRFDFGSGRFEATENPDYEYQD